MNKKVKVYLKLNLVSIFFIAVSFISLTLAWFAYSGLSTVHTEVNVKAWYIKMERDGFEEKNNITISMEDIYPGMQPFEEEIRIKNLGDSDAQVGYNILGARILDIDNYIATDELTSENIEDQLAHKYPFHINIHLTKNYIDAQTDEALFKVSISWPLDSGTDNLDSYWGNEAYNFKTNEQKKKDNDNSYQALAAIKLDISLTAEQYIDSPENRDIKYRIGEEILYDTQLNKACTEEKGSCIRTNIIGINKTYTGTNNDKLEIKVKLLPKISNLSKTVTYPEMSSLYSEQITGWGSTTEILNLKDVLGVISRDITSSVISIPNLSDSVIGNIKYGNRIDTVINNTISKKGYFKFLNKFTYLYSNDCYWLNTEYDETTIFAVQTFDEEMMKISSTSKDTSCKVVPVIIANLSDLEV